MVIEGARSVDDSVVAAALVEVSSYLYDAQFMSRASALRRGDIRIVGEALEAVRVVSEMLVERFVLPAVHMAAAVGPQRSPQRRTLGAATRGLWKPADRLWTAPVVEPASAWVSWARKTGNARTWDRQFRYESPPKTERFVVDSLANADRLVGRGSFEETARALASDGVARIDFTWRCVLEAECSALRGERSPISYPCALGTESSIWLTAPEPLSEDAEGDIARYDYPHEVSDWFAYR